MTPDAKGTYEDAGEFNGKRSYQRTPDGWFIWWDGASIWTISTERGNPGMEHWLRNDPDIEGEYEPMFLVEGTATVTEI